LSIESHGFESVFAVLVKGLKEEGTHSERGKNLSSIVEQHPVNLQAKDPSSESVRWKKTTHQSLKSRVMKSQTFETDL